MALRYMGLQALSTREATLDEITHKYGSVYYSQASSSLQKQIRVNDAVRTVGWGHDCRADGATDDLVDVHIERTGIRTG